MSLSESIQDLVGKYSVTGVLKERLDFELARAAAQRDDAAKELGFLREENTSLKEQNSFLKTMLQKVETDRDELRHQLETQQQLAPATELDMGAEMTLAALMNNPSGVRVDQIFRGLAIKASANDALVWIDEFKEHGFVELARADMGNGCEFRLTSSGRKYAREYFARQETKR